MSTKKAGILDQATAQHKPPWALSDEEVLQLMQTYTQDKSCILEQDAMTLCRWAQAHKCGAYVLQLVLEGHMRVEVEGQKVKVGLRP